MASGPPQRATVARVLERSAWFLELVAELVSTELDGKLLGLRGGTAVVAMADGSAALIHESEPNLAADELAAQLGSFVRDNRGLNLKLIVLGGGGEIRRVLSSAQPRIGFGRVVQVFFVADNGATWCGARSRLDSPTGRAIERVLARSEATHPALDVLKARVTPPTVEERVRHEEHHRFVMALRTGLPWASLSVLSLIALVFLGEAIWGGTEFIPTLVRMGANDARALAGEPWRLLSATWLHAGMLHVVVNGFALYSMGGFVERLLGWRRFVVLYVAAALGGGIASAVFARAALSVGASGAVFGLLGAAAALAFRPSGLIPPSAVAGLRRSAIVNLLANLAISLAVPEIDIMAHAGGALIGAALVFTRAILPGRQAGVGHGELRMTMAAVFAIALSVSALGIALAHGKPWKLLELTPTHTVELAEIGVTLDVPQTLSAPQQLDTDAFAIGSQLDDAGVLVVAVQSHGLELHDAEQRQAYREQIVASLPSDEPELTSLSVRADAELGSRTVVEWRYRVGTEIEVVRWDWVETHDRFTIEAVWWAGRPEVAPALRAAAASLR